MSSRYREETSPESTSILTKTYNGAPFATHEAVSSSYSKSITDVVTPNYQSRISKGDIINNPCYMAVHDHTSGNGSYSGVSDNQQHKYIANGGSLSSYHATFGTFGQAASIQVDDYNTAALVNQAKQFAIAEIDSTPYAFGEDAFELRETLRFLRNPLQSIANLVQSFSKEWYRLKRRKGRPPIYEIIDNPERLIAISDLWLQYRFAATPLIRSAVSAVDAYTERKTKTKFPERKIARGHRTGKTTTTDVQISYLGGGSYDTFRRTYKSDVDISCGIMYSVSNPIDNFRTRLGLRTKDIPYVMWQILPLSFMVDRVFDISRFIAGITNLVDPQVKILTGWERTKYNRLYEFQLMSEVVPGYTVSALGDTVRTKDFSYDRAPWRPSPSDAFPRVTAQRLVEDATSISDLLALTYSRLKGV